MLAKEVMPVVENQLMAAREGLSTVRPLPSVQHKQLAAPLLALLLAFPFLSQIGCSQLPAVLVRELAAVAGAQDAAGVDQPAQPGELESVEVAAEVRRSVLAATAAMPPRLGLLQRLANMAPVVAAADRTRPAAMASPASSSFAIRADRHVHLCPGQEQPGDQHHRVGRPRQF
jgi:hypothetical protein